ncbi:hypothetical protein HDU83_008905 [Entophlyctis luteolus]|nr:hypothetical protein HDU83_008905 [Entophlyctis luteolus]KAJ3375583.1 hypothetical protein HDU84_000553 [Entophlyctis sp. JEL0112]
MPDFNTVRFTNGPEIFDYVDPAILPIDYGGTMTNEKSRLKIDFIRRHVNWKTYRDPQKRLVIRPESAISVKTVDSDIIDAELEALGIKGDGDDVGAEISQNKQVMKDLQDFFRIREQIVDNILMFEISVNKRGHAYNTSQGHYL